MTLYVSPARVVWGVLGVGYPRRSKVLASAVCRPLCDEPYHKLIQ